MLLTTLFILSSALPPMSCSQRLLQLEDTYRLWTSSSRTVTATYEQHRYFTVTRDGQTVIVTLRATRAKPAGFTSLEPCTFDSKPAAVYYQVTVKQ